MSETPTEADREAAIEYLTKDAGLTSEEGARSIRDDGETIDLATAFAAYRVKVARETAEKCAMVYLVEVCGGSKNEARRFIERTRAIPNDFPTLAAILRAGGAL